MASPASLLAAPPDSPTAQTVEGDERKKADDLFRAGRQLMREGRVEEACPLLEQSQALDPAGGTLLNLSRCYESLGRFASADAVLARAWRIGRVKGRADAIDFIEAERVRVAPAIDHVVLVLASLPPEAIVEFDGKVIAERAPRVTLDIDPGKHEASVRAQGYVEVRVGFELAPKDDLEGRVVEIRLPALSRRRDEGKPAPPPLLPRPAPPAKTTAASAPGPTTPQELLRPAGEVSLVAGGVSLLAGLALGAVAAAKWSDAEEVCPERRCNDEGARDDADTASTAAALSTGFFIGGVALGGVGLTLILAAPGGPARDDDDRRAGLAVSGAF